MSDNKKEDLVEAVKELIGVVPPDLRSTLKLLSHPHVLDHTIEYFGALDLDQRCLHYEEPWDCELESQAKYETVYYAWRGDLTFTEEWKKNWCRNCRKRLDVV